MGKGHSYQIKSLIYSPSLLQSYRKEGVMMDLWKGSKNKFAWHQSPKSCSKWIQSILQPFLPSRCLLVLPTLPSSPPSSYCLFFLAVSSLCCGTWAKHNPFFHVWVTLWQWCLAAAVSSHQLRVVDSPLRSSCPFHLLAAHFLLQWSSTFLSVITFLRFIFISVPDVTKVHKSVSIDFWQQSLLVLH